MKIIKSVLLFLCAITFLVCLLLGSIASIVGHAWALIVICTIGWVAVGISIRIILCAKVGVVVEGERISFCSCQAGGYSLKMQNDQLVFCEQDSRGDWGNDILLVSKSQGAFSTAVTELKWERNNELRKLEDYRGAKSYKSKSVYLEKINRFLKALHRLKEE